MSEKILITGGMGFIGSHLAYRLAGDGHSVTLFGNNKESAWNNSGNSANLTCISAPLSNTELLGTVLTKTDVIFHKAAVLPTSESTRDIFHENVAATQSLIDAISSNAKALHHLVFDSSISVYGEGCYCCPSCGNVRPPLRQPEAFHKAISFELKCQHCQKTLTPIKTNETAERNGASAYARSKIVQEDLLCQAAEKFKFNLTILRYATVYGPNQRAENPYSRFRQALLKGGKIRLSEDGLQKRDFIYIDDVIDANLRSIQNWSKGTQTFNIGTGVESTLLRFIERGREIVANNGIEISTEIEITHKLIEGDVRHCMIDCSRAQDALKFQARTNLAVGLERWLQTTHDNTDCIT